VHGDAGHPGNKVVDLKRRRIRNNGGGLGGGEAQGVAVRRGQMNSTFSVIFSTF
jgi:hypothetical protein